MPEPEPILGRMEAAALLAVDQANGGELSSLAQVLATFEQTFNRKAVAGEFSEALTLLAEAQLVEYSHHEVGLAPKGRRLLRRSGAPWDRHRPQRLTALLEELDERDLAPPGSVPAPSDADVRAALGELRDDAAAGRRIVPGDELAPSAQSPGALGLGSIGAVTLPGGLRVSFGQLRNPDQPRDGEGSSEGWGDGEGDSEGEGWGDSEGEGWGDSEGEGWGDSEGEGWGDSEGEGWGDSEGEGWGDSEGGS